LSYYELGNYQAVVSMGKTASILNLDQKDFFLYYAGLAAYQIKEYDQSIDAFEECIKLNPSFTQAYEYLAFAYKAKGMQGAAHQMTDRAMSLKRTQGDLKLRGDENHPLIF
jgi:tetratricopeptide (TPR) repeat protein